MYVVFLVYVINYLVLVVCVRECVCVSRRFLCFYYLTVLLSVRNKLYIKLSSKIEILRAAMQLFSQTKTLNDHDDGHICRR